MFKLCIGFVFLGAAAAIEGGQWYESNTMPFYELPCLSGGGICLMADDCPEGQLAKTSGLCPLQQSGGVECCYGLPKSERRCRYRGGECVPQSNRCPENLTFKANDCEADEKCCILVK